LNFELEKMDAGKNGVWLGIGYPKMVWFCAVKNGPKPAFLWFLDVGPSKMHDNPQSPTLGCLILLRYPCIY
jgi:hypothetical protein